MAAVTLTTIAIGAAIGAGVGAVATYASGGRGDALWKGALTGAVGGAITGGVGSWAGSAAGLGLSGTAAGALGGLAGGVGAGALGTALSGGNSSDYLRNIATGGLGGAALGAAGGYLSGGESAAGGVNPVTGEAVPTGSPEITALPEGDLATGVNTGATAAPTVQASVTGPTPTATQPTTTPLADTSTPTLSQSAFGNAGTQTALEPTSTTSFDSIVQGAKQPSSILDNINAPTAAMAEGSTPFSTTTPKPEQSTGGDWWKGYTSGLGTTTPTTTGTPKMGLEDYLKLQGKAQLLGGGTKLLGALATAPETQQNRNQLMDLYNQQNDANQFYQNQLQQTYQNPQGYLGSPEAAATRSAALQKILAQNAAAGRRTAGSAAYNQLMMNQLQNLNAYRAGIPRPQYGTAAQTLNYAQQYSPTADIFGGLASMATPLSLYSLFG